MAKRRRTETSEERHTRHLENAQNKGQAEAAADRTTDDMIKQSIKDHGA